jgi:dTDP-4-dehydrorhamnose 3,5-epimerase-like enzyme
MDAIEVGHRTGIYPEDPTIPTPLPFVNNAGSIQNFAIGTFKTATVIISKGRTVRSNHYHKTDSHVIYVLDGSCWYYWRDIKSQGPGTKDIKDKHYFPGQAFFTPPLIEHATFFPRHTTLFVVSRYSRDHESHESDLVRVKLAEWSDTEGLTLIPRSQP